MRELSKIRKTILTVAIVAVSVSVPSFKGTAASLDPFLQTDATFLPEDLTSSDLTLDQTIAKKLGIDRTVTGSIRKEPELLSYCLNIHDDAREARTAILTQRLNTVETGVDEKLVQLEERIAELREWTQKREAFLVKANDSLVQIFQTMRPDAAALQLTEVGPAMAAAIISKLQPKYSSAIMTEMKPADAAKVAMVLTNALGKRGKLVN